MRDSIRERRRSALDLDSFHRFPSDATTAVDEKSGWREAAFFVDASRRAIDEAVDARSLPVGRIVWVMSREALTGYPTGSGAMWYYY